MTTKVTATDNNTRVQIRKILVPIDGSECSLTAAKYATRIAKDGMRAVLYPHYSKCTVWAMQLLQLQ